MLKQQRLDQLADGIFAIVMTLLVLEIKVPELYQYATEAKLVSFLIHNIPIFISYALSFTLLFVYWRGHHYIASIYAHNIDQRLSAINAIFLLFVALVPFSTHFLGLYSFSQTAIIVYGIHMVLISLTLFWMRMYIRNSSTIENEELDHDTEVRGMMRIIMPALMALLAIALSFINPLLSLTLYFFAIFFNLASSSTKHTNKLFKFITTRLFKK
jgi:uncharacterized membrane protein